MKLKFIQIILNTKSPKKGSKVHLYRILSLQFIHIHIHPKDYKWVRVYGCPNDEYFWGPMSRVSPVTQINHMKLRDPNNFALLND